MVQSNVAVGETFSERELEILDALAEGLSNQAIADKLYIALKTVKWYNTQIFAKLGVVNRQDAVEAAQRLALGARSRAPIAVPNNLPAQATPFIGRKRELSELHALLSDPAIRLVTILGPGGMGKTRLSLQVAEEHLSSFPDGVFVAKLAPLDSSGTALDAIAQLFQLQHYGGAQDGLLETVTHYLHTKTMLLVLDNFEHLLGSASTLADVLQSALGVKILVTSRERLNVHGEQVYILKGMGVSPRDQSSSDHDALRLFAQTVQRTQAGYQLGEADWAHVVRICQLVGGMPLALELAAGWMDTLTAERIAAEIAECIDILETEMRDVPERHRSIRATFDQTWTRLNDDERHVLMYASVFPGGFTEQAAEAVTGANIRTLRRLTNKALLYRDDDDRFDLHELIRQYGEQKLRESGEYDDAIERFISYFSSYVEHVADICFDLVERDTVLGAMRETENIVRAWNHVLERKYFEILGRMRPAVSVLLTIGGDTYEQVALLSKAADAVKDAATDEPAWGFLHATLRANIADISLGIRPFAEAHQLAREAVDLLAPYGPTEELSYAHLTAICEPFYAPTTDREERLRSAQLAADIAKEVGSRRYQIKALASLIDFYLEVDDEEAALDYASRLWALTPPPVGDRPSPAWALRLMARLLAHQKKVGESAQCWQRLLELLDGYGFVYYESDAHRALSDMYLAQGDLARAKEQHKASIRLHQKYARDWQMLGTLLGGFARWLLMPIGEYAYAVEILSFVSHHPVAPSKYVVHAKQLLDDARGKLSADEFDRAVERGKQMKLAQVVEDALAYLSA